MTSNKKRVRLSDIIGPAFYETHKLIDMGVIDEAVESGGRASLKSSYVGTEVVLQLVKHPDCHALVTRQVGDTMRDSVYAQILWAIDKLGLTTKFKCTQSPLQCTYLPTGQRILFRGLDDPQKIKSIKLPFGYIGMRQLREFLGLAPRVRRNKRIVSHPQPHKVGKYRAPHLRPDPHPHLPRDRLQEYHSKPEIVTERSCSRADEAQDDSDTDNTDEGDHLCLTG